MSRLTDRDRQTLLAAIAELNSDLDPRTLPARAISAAAKLIAADSVAFTGFSSSGEFESLTWNNSEGLVPEIIEVFAEYYLENPLVNELIIKRRPETLKITDLISPAEFKRTNVYNEFYKKVGVTNQLVALLTISDDFLMSCSINTGKEDFSDRDKLMLTLAAPHFASAVRNAFAYDQLLAALETKTSGIIALDSQGLPVYLSRYAEQLLEGYFPGEQRQKNCLPLNLNLWLTRSLSLAESSDINSPPAPFKVENRRGILSVRLMSHSVTREKTLLLEEQKSLSTNSLKTLNLTKRETEILFQITQGQTDQTIASILGISLRTVHKHIEHLYAKMGVETRTGAMLKALEIDR